MPSTAASITATRLLMGLLAKKKEVISSQPLSWLADNECFRLHNDAMFSSPHSNTSFAHKEDIFLLPSVKVPHRELGQADLAQSRLDRLPVKRKKAILRYTPAEPS